MKRVIISSRYNDYDGWTQEDIDLHKSIDWKARNYNDYPVKSDSFIGYVYMYGKKNGEYDFKRVKFVKYLRSNPIYAPYYGPAEPQFNGQAVGPMYDGTHHGQYDVHDRYDTQELYDMLSR